MAATNLGYRGPRPDADPADGLPTLTPGQDVLPTRCAHCGSRRLLAEPPLGRHQRGMLWCELCSRTACWLAADPGRVRQRIAAPRPVEVVRHTRPLVVQSLVQTPGCGPACSLLYGHDPHTHEAYGAGVVRAELATFATGTVRTGPLAVDFDRAQVSLDGAVLALAPGEHRLLSYLASRLGMTCRYGEIVTAVWDPQTADVWARAWRYKARWHALRIAMMRLRSRLGTAASLIETVPRTGYRLTCEEAI